MSHFLKDSTDSDFKVLYTDTNSIFINGELPDYLIGTGLGQFKHEMTYKEIVFLAPKVYGGIISNGLTKATTEISKIKGYKNQVSFKDLKKLLIKNENLELVQDKWFKNVIEGNISIQDQIYNLKVNQNKRLLI